MITGQSVTTLHYNSFLSLPVSHEHGDRNATVNWLPLSGITISRSSFCQLEILKRQLNQFAIMSTLIILMNIAIKVLTVKSPVSIPHKHHRRCLCKFFLSNLSFHIKREKLYSFLFYGYFEGVFICLCGVKNGILKILPVLKK